MKNIALAILCVGLVASNLYLTSKGMEQDVVVSFFAVISAIAVFLV